MSSCPDVLWAGPVDGSGTAPARGAPVAGLARELDLAGLDDAALAREASTGNREAFGLIVERHQRPVYRLCYRFAGRHEDAADLAQDVFVRAWRALPRFRGESSVGTWLYRIGVNVGLNFAAARRPDCAPIEPDRHHDAGAWDPDGAAIARERDERVRAAIARLPRRQRAVVILRVYQELPHREIARILGSSTGAVKANFCHALAKLRKLLSPS